MLLVGNEMCTSVAFIRMVASVGSVLTACFAAQLLS